jgi:hypothetical protein
MTRQVSNSSLVRSLSPPGSQTYGEIEETLTIEGSLVGDIVDEKDTHRAAIIGRRDGAEALLASSIPDLELHALAIELNGANLEVDANSGDEGRGEGVLAETQQAA